MYNLHKLVYDFISWWKIPGIKYIFIKQTRVPLNLNGVFLIHTNYVQFNISTGREELVYLKSSNATEFFFYLM